MSARCGRRPRLVVLLFGLALALGCGPLGPLAGGRLRGEVVAGPVGDWDFAAQEDRLQLETRPEEPHSVNTWFVGIGRHLYVPTSMIRGPEDPSERSWVANVTRNPEVRLRIAGRVYERKAVRVRHAREYARALAALDEKYGLDPEERDPERSIWIYRMDPRAAREAADR